MNVVLVNQFFPPARAPTGWVLGDLAEELVRRGHAVTVVTSAANYGAESGAQRAMPAGVQVMRVGRSDLHRNGAAAKLGGYFSFFRSAWRELARLPRPDALACMTTPPFVGLLGARLRKRQGVPYVLWCMDLYPEALSAHGILRPWNPLAPLLRKFARIERARAAAVVALGSDMAELLAASGARRIEEIPFWSEFAATPAQLAEARGLRRARGWADDEIILLYSGNMGRAHRAEEFAALAARLKDRVPRCRCVFAGGGPNRAEWERRWGGVLEFIRTAPGESYVAHLLAAEVHLVSQQPAWKGVVVPSKFQIACALGRPVVFAGPPASAVGQWLAAAEAGWVVAPGDATAIEAAACGISDAKLRAAKGANAQRLFRDRFTKAANCGKVADLIERAAKEGP